MSHWATDTIYMAAAQFISGILGFFYRVFLSNRLGPEGMGIYQQIMAFYFTAITVITAGIPLSVSKLVAEAESEVQSIGGTVAPALWLTAGFSALGSGFLIVSSKVFGLSEALLVLPAAIMVGFSAVLRGYFLGIRSTAPLRWAILLESAVRVVAGIVLVSKGLIPWEGKTLGAISALAIGELVSLAIYAFSFRDSFKKLATCPLEKKSIINILRIAVPVSLSQIIGSVSGSLEAILLPKSLNSFGLSTSVALSLYGKIAGMALPLIYFPSLFIMSLSSNIIPRISRTLALGRPAAAYHLAQKTLTVSGFFSFGVAGFFIALGEPVGDFLFPGLELEGIIRTFAVGIPFSYTGSFLRSIMRGAGNHITPLINSALSAAISLALLCALTPIWGFYGYAIASITADAITSWISIAHLERAFGRPLDLLGILLRPLICSAFMVLIILRTYEALAALEVGNLMAMALSALLGGSGYLLMTLALGFRLKEFTL